MFLLVEACEDSTVLKIIHFVLQLLKAGIVLVPVALIILGMIDFFKAATSNDESKMKQAVPTFTRRIIGSIIIFLVPALISFAFGLLGSDIKEGYLACIANATPEKILQIKKQEEEELAKKNEEYQKQLAEAKKKNEEAYKTEDKKEQNSDTTFAKSKNVKVLMIGNSKIKRENNSNTTKKHLEGLVKGAGRKISITRVTHGGEKLKTWADEKNPYGKKAYDKIKEKKWDVVILQEQTDASINNKNTLVNSGKKLAKAIRKVNPNAKIIFDAIWPYKNSKKSSNQKKIDANNEAAAKEVNGIVAYAGKAFLKYSGIKNAKEVYSSDKNHASNYGWYLQACVFYAAIFNESPETTGYYGNLDKSQAKTMQKIAAQLQL